MRAFTRAVRMFMLALILSLGLVQPALAADGEILRDTETEALFRDIARPLIIAAKLDPKSTDVVLLNDTEINAFVATGQRVYIHSGLLLAADNVNQLQGVIAHELGHVAGGHSIRLQQGAKGAAGLTLATMILGAIALAAGAGEAGMGIIAAGQQAAMGQFLAFTRGEESSADQAARVYLSTAGISGKGMLDFFGKLQDEEYRLAIYSKDSYGRTHPLSRERIDSLREGFKADPAWNKPVDPALESRFQLVKAKLMGFTSPNKATQKYGPDDKSLQAHYARAYAYHVGGYPQQAELEARALLAAEPQNPYFLELLGQILLETGKPKDALDPLREATERSNHAPLIASMLGHALVATEDRSNFAEAKQVLKESIGLDNQNPFAWYQLGIVYESEGDIGRAALATAERSNLEGENRRALASAEAALKNIPENTPDWLRAQDIAMVSKAELEKNKKDRRERD